MKVTILGAQFGHFWKASQCWARNMIAFRAMLNFTMLQAGDHGQLQLRADPGVP
jgi:hypothetical protein